MHADITFGQLDRLTDYRLGIFDRPCPACGPSRRDLRNRKRHVLRIWRQELDFCSYNCARCGIRGGIGNGHRSGTAASRANVPAEHIDDHLRTIRQAAKARHLWRGRKPATGSPVEHYLRRARGYAGPIPQTIGYLPPIKANHHAAMIAAFGHVTEPEPGTIAIDPETITGIHLTLLRPDGLDKADTAPSKLTVGPSVGLPIVISPMNDLLGLIICEGVETGLSLCEATGCGVWAAGPAGRMPALASVVPAYVDTVTIAGEQDGGWPHALELARRLQARYVHVEMRAFGQPEASTS